ncbi:helix-hairpin-helix domain-containing protein [Terriglobus tenax]|uniref:helix-hairpin-helix domain-containing protein n=1 Tax=Terriglobus tenax TaxID=1111115 RepID=UPI0021DFB209|nr:helix-hairpin-helix domain-containing protein [Terriglobus tenax]
MRRSCLAVAVAALALLSQVRGLHAQQLPEGPTRDLVTNTCSRCHEFERVLSQHQDKDGWTAVVNKMVSLGLQTSDDDLKKIVDYLATNLPAETIQKLNINKMTAVQFETTLAIPRPLSRAIIEYRDKNGDFKTLDDLKKVPGLDPAKVDAKKDRLTP